jgi:hypothetical protein
MTVSKATVTPQPTSAIREIIIHPVVLSCGTKQTIVAVVPASRAALETLKSQRRRARQVEPPKSRQVNRISADGH